MSADGKIAGTERKQIRISSDEDMARVMQMRRNCDGILVGVGTVISDDPRLTVKGDVTSGPTRVVLDSHGRTPDDNKILDGSVKTIIVTCEGCTREWKNAKTIRTGKNTLNLVKTLDILHDDFKINDLLVEGGGRTIASFFKEDLVDEYTVFVGGIIIGGADSPTPADGNGWVTKDGLKMKLTDCRPLGNGALLTFNPINRT